MARCKGVPTDQPPNPKEAGAFCEGRRAAVDGALIGDNPYLLEPNKANWARGHASATDDPANSPGRDCCADVYGAAYVPP